jgi:hypothetical protein
MELVADGGSLVCSHFSTRYDRASGASTARFKVLMRLCGLIGPELAGVGAVSWC